MRVSPGEEHIFGEPERRGVLLPEGKPVAEQEFKSPGIAGIRHYGVPEKRPHDLKKFRQQFREQPFDWVFTSAFGMGDELLREINGDCNRIRVCSTLAKDPTHELMELVNVHLRAAVLGCLGGEARRQSKLVS